MLDMQCFSFLNRALENELSPLVIMASNRGMTRIRGSKMKSPHGLPVDLLDRVLIVSTNPYTAPEHVEIIKIRYKKYLLPCSPPADAQAIDNRCEEEDVQIEPDALRVLATMSRETTLRYALNMISCAQVIATRRKAAAVATEDLKMAYIYFMDDIRSVQWLKDHQGKLIDDFEEPNAGGAMDTDDDNVSSDW